MLKVIKPSNHLLNVCHFCFNIFSCAAKFWLHRQFSSAHPRNEEMMGDVVSGATAAGLFWTVNVCWAHPVISRASAVASAFFSWCYSWCFWCLQNRMCRKLNNPKQWVEISLLTFINVCQVITSLYSWINWRFRLWRGNFSAGVSGNTKTMHTGFSAYTYCIMPTPRCWHGRNRRYGLARGKICVCSECSQ